MRLQHEHKHNGAARKMPLTAARDRTRKTLERGSSFTATVIVTR
jgi:hypothetical protein